MVSKRRHTILLVAILSLSCTIGFGQIKKEEIQVIDTTKSLEDAFAFFSDEIADYRVVALGEQTHTPDASFAIRAKLMEYLVEHHDFEVVLFEAGMFDLTVANDLVKETSSIDSLKGSLYGFWSKPTEHKGMFNYFQSVIDRKLPLRFGGFDCKLTSPYGRSQGRYTQKLTQVLQEAKANTSTSEYELYLKIWESIEADMQEGGLKSFSYKMEPEEKEEFLQLSRFFEEKLRSSGNDYWAQMMHTVDESVALYSDFRLLKAIFNKNSMLELNNRRDVLMAENLDYLLYEVYPDKKVLLIGATYHFVRNVSKISPSKVGLDLSRSITMGEIAHETGRDEFFVVGFTAPKTTKCKAKSENPNASLYCMQNDLGYEMAYFPLHKWNLAEADEDKQQVIEILHPKKPTQHPNWNHVLDAVVLINK